MRYLILATLCLCTSAAYAATFADDMEAIGLLSFAYASVAAMAGGLVARFRKSRLETPPQPLSRWDGPKDVAISYVAGMVTFLAATGVEVNGWKIPSVWIALATTIGGYGGTKILDRYLSKYLEKVDKA